MFDGKNCNLFGYNFGLEVFVCVENFFIYGFVVSNFLYFDCLVIKYFGGLRII